MFKALSLTAPSSITRAELSFGSTHPAVLTSAQVDEYLLLFCNLNCTLNHTMAGFSIAHIAEGFKSVCKRFPLTVICCTVLTWLLSHLLTNSYFEVGQAKYYTRLAIAVYNCMLLSIATQLYIERLSVYTLARTLLYVCTVTICYLWYLQSQPINDIQYTYSNFIISCSLHLSVAIAAFSRQGSNYAFWQFNRIIFLRILLSFLYSGVLFIGIALALLGIDQLLKIEVDSASYTLVWCLLFVFFTTVFFLAGLPKIEEIEAPEQTPFPRGLKVFTANVLLPLVLVYLSILYFYSLRLFLHEGWQAPWTAYFVSIAAVFGILSLLLLHPLIEQQTSSLLRKVFISFFCALLPLVILSLASVGKQIADFGVTENRYILFVICTWLLWLSLRYIINATAKLYTIPVSLLVIGLLTVFGPWSMSPITINSQKNKLSTLLQQNGVLVAGKVPKKANTKTLALESYEEIDEKLYFLMKRCEPAEIQDLFEAPLTATSKDAWEKKNYILSVLSTIKEPLKNSHAGTTTMAADEGAIEYRYYELDAKQVLTISKYNNLAEVDLENVATDTYNFAVEKNSYQFYFSKKRQTFVLSTKTDSVFFETADFYQRLWQHQGATAYTEQMTLETTSSRMKAKLVVSKIQLNKVIDISAGTIKAKLLFTTLP